ncbi:MAG: Gfo/Idh/MocA family oxidoreductase [Clostridia bacterium]|nr:Gfo/Idh/MocA family oxidoreductase [Clostridia bacterium]
MNKIKVGVFGAGRGAYLAKSFMLLNCEIVALCDFHPERREAARKDLGLSEAASYDDFDAFINHGMDAMIVANSFNEHAKYVLKCFERGIHVFCECIANGTMAEGVQLAVAAEKTSSIFFLAENYPQMKFNLEMQRVVKSGTLGKIIYAEGEYNHPVADDDVAFKKEYVFFEKHWRNYCPRTYYITHSLGPVMRATGATPVTVSALEAFAPPAEQNPSASYVGDRAAIITTMNNDGSIFRVTGCAAFGGHHNAYRICGTEGQIENLRGMGEKVMLRYNHWSKPEGKEEYNLYEPEWNDKDEEMIKNSGHGGGDFITVRMFVDCIKNGVQPEHPFDLHSALAMSSVAILGHRSALAGGKPFAIPDFRKEEDRKLYENDDRSPMYREDGTAPTLPSCSHPDYAPTEEQKHKFRDLLGIK